VGNFVIGLWALIIAFGLYGYGLSGLFASLAPSANFEEASSALVAWLILVGMPAVGFWLRSRERKQRLP